MACVLTRHQQVKTYLLISVNFLTFEKSKFMGRAIASGDKAFFQKFEKEISNPVALVLKAKEGIGIQVFDSLLNITNLTKNELASFIDATPKTIDNYRLRKQKLSRSQSEHLLQVLSLYNKGLELFGSTEAFNQWLYQPAFGLGNIKPYDLMFTAGGVNLIMEELLRIEFGALA